MHPVVAPRPVVGAAGLAAVAGALALALAVTSPPDPAPAMVAEPVRGVRAPPPPGPLEVLAIPLKAAVAPRAPLPIAFFVVNRSDEMLLALPSLDGSDEEWRFPKIAVEAFDTRGQRVPTEAPERHRRCGNVNDLDAADFVLVPPGGAIDLTVDDRSFGIDAYAPLVPGQYTFRLRYDLSFVGWDRAEHSPGTDDLIPLLPRGIYFSEPITLQVTTVPLP